MNTDACMLACLLAGLLVWLVMVTDTASPADNAMAEFHGGLCWHAGNFGAASR